jgi:hypothetical protein
METDNKLKMESNSNYFSFEVNSKINFENRSESDKDYLLEMVIMIFVKMSINDVWFSFLSSNGYNYIFLFKSKGQKRLEQLQRLCQKYLPSSNDFNITEYDKVTFQAKLKQLQNSPEEWIPIKLVTHSYEFTKSELELEKFDNEEYWFPWQKEIYSKIFDEKGNIIRPDKRKIISIIDKEGKKGKSEFLKWICHNYPKECIKLSQASESQLRAAVIKCGPKRCYFFDLRQIDELNDKMDNLMSIIDEIKNGHVMNTIYGANQSLIMPNPHLFIFSNKALKYDSLSKDRWEIYEISNDFKFKSIDINTNISQDGEIVLKKITSNLPFLKKRNILALIVYFMLSLYR